LKNLSNWPPERIGLLRDLLRGCPLAQPARASQSSDRPGKFAATDGRAESDTTVAGWGAMCITDIF
jgi:hypothetical protein